MGGEPATPGDVDSYIAGAAEKARPILHELRRVITSTVPTVEEKISWGVPFSSADLQARVPTADMATPR